MTVQELLQANGTAYNEVLIKFKDVGLDKLEPRKDTAELEDIYLDMQVKSFWFEEVKIKLFSVKVKNEDTVMTINDIRKQYGDLGGDSCIKYVLRENGYTEIIYRDCYKEI